MAKHSHQHKKYYKNRNRQKGGKKSKSYRKALYKGVGKIPKDRRKNIGLYFQKFVSKWEAKNDKADYISLDKTEWLDDICKLEVDSKRLEDMQKRQKELIEALGGEVFEIKSTSRVLLGLGYNHPLENGFLFHHTLGVPFIRGTSLKGLLKEFAKNWESREVDSILGYDEGKKGIGSLTIFDAIPRKFTFVKEIITPHYGPYYSNGDIPGDWYSPVPIYFLAVDKGARFQVGYAKNSHGEIPNDFNPKDLLLDALKILGIGAKTSSGYGRFELVKNHRE